jgi:hemerythrin-like domain-containing protein
MTSPLTLHAPPGAGFDQPFEMLLACHERVERMLGLLERLALHLVQHGCTPDAAQAARDVMRYFDIAGPAHHEDEERHLFPALAASGEPGLVALVSRLQQDHRAMSSSWACVRGDLLAVAAGQLPGESGARQARWSAFAGLYREHIVAEEIQAYPAARPLILEPALGLMGQEMARRRGAR